MTQTTQMTEVENITVGSHSKEPASFKNIVEEYVSLPYHEVNFMTGKDIRARGDRMNIETHIKFKITADQCYFHQIEEK